MDEIGNTPPTDRRASGAQPGNRNALKHGFYSRLLLPDEKKSLNGDSLGQLNDEITMLRALLYRTVKSFRENPPTSFMEHVRALRAVTLAINCLQGTIRAQKDVYNEGGHTMDELMDKALQELSRLPWDQD